MFPEPLVGSDQQKLTNECRMLREMNIDSLPSPDEVIDFLDGYNALINHEMPPFIPMREVNILL